MRILISLLISIAGQTAFADSKFGNGIIFDLGLGYGSAVIQNPDSTKANYKILGLKGVGLIPLLEGDSFGAHLAGGLRYLDLQNNSNNGKQTEVANMFGPTVGLRLRAYKFFAQYDYGFMFARHYAVGTISRSSKYDMPVNTITGGLTIPLKQLAVSFAYSQSSGTVPKASSQLSKDSPYNDQVYWLQVSYSTGLSLRQFFGFLF